MHFHSCRIASRPACRSASAYLSSTVAIAGIAAIAALLTVAQIASAQSGGIDPAQLPGIVQDDVLGDVGGTWQNSTHTKPFVGAGYLYSSGGEGSVVKFTLDVPKDGPYQVLVAYTPGSNRSDRAVVNFETADGQQTAIINQQVRPAGPYCFHPLGEFRFVAGKAIVAVSAESNEKGVVVADAVQLLTPAQFVQAQADAAKTSPKLLAALKPAPKKPLAKKAAAKKEAAIAEKPPEFVRHAPSKQFARLTPAQLDDLMQHYVGGIREATPIDDEDYLRRLTLDFLGRQPTMQEIAAFLGEASLDKRAQAVERLLASPEFGENWANYWSDVISYRTPQPELTFLNYDPFKKWLAESFNQDRGWDETTFRIISAVGVVGENPAATYVGFHQGDKSRLAAETTRVFMSTQIQCAECHDHKFIDMPQETFHHVAAFFVRVQTKLPWNDSSAIVVSSKAAGEYKMPEGKAAMQPIAFSDRKVDLGGSDLQRRTELADWIVSPDNPWFAKAFVNRVWARMMGRGFCEPVDEIGELGDRVLPEVHTALAEHFIASTFDAKEVFRLIANSRSYQRELRDPTKDETKPFAVVSAGRLRGDEVFASLQTALALPNITPEATKATAEIRFPPPPKSTRDLVNETFGFDPSSDAGNIVRTMQQAMFLMNNKQVQAQIDASPGSGTLLARLLSGSSDDRAIVNQLYESVLARQPTAAEINIAQKHLTTVGDRRAAYEDLLWSMVNSAEFLSRR